MKRSSRRANLRPWIWAGCVVSLLIVTHAVAGPDLQIAGKIVFVRSVNWPTDAEIYVMNADGTGQTRLTNNSALDTEPVWSPDGSKIAFVSDRTGGGWYSQEIYVMNADGTGVTRLTSNSYEEGGPSWSPDGSKIAFQSKRNGYWNVYVMNADGTGETPLTSTQYGDGDGTPMWSPDGNKIAFQSGRHGELEIYVMNADGTAQTRLTNNPAHDAVPRWSPDGTKIAFCPEKDGNREVYVMNADGTGQTNITNNTADDFFPRWSPDGTMFAFVSNRDGTSNIHVMNADGSNVTRLISEPGTAHGDWFAIRHLGTVFVGAPVSRTMTIENKGDAMLVVSNITSSDGQFAASPTNFSVAPGSSQPVAVTFTPTAAGTQYSTLTITSNDPQDGTVRLTINGTGMAVPTLAVSVPDTVTGYDQALSIPVRVEDTTGQGIVSAEVFLAYDGGLLTATGVNTTGTLLTPHWSIETNLVEGVGTAMDTLKIAMATDDDVLSGAGILIYVDFQVADLRHPASSPLRLTHVLLNDGAPGNLPTDGSVTLVGVDGTIASDPAEILPRWEIEITVAEADENRQAAGVDSFAVAVTSGGQTEVLRVRETGTSTGVFTGVIGTVFSLGFTSGDGRVQAKAGDQISFCYADSLDGAGDTVERCTSTNVIGGTDGTVRATVVSQPGDTVRVRVSDADLSGTVAVNVANPRTGESESILLSQFSAGTSVFYGRFFTGTTAGAGDSALAVQKGDVLAITYQDTLTAEGGKVTVVDDDEVVNPFGDAHPNGSVQAYDAAQVLIHRLSTYGGGAGMLSGLDSLSANLDQGAPWGIIDGYDAALILQKVVGLISRFEVQEPDAANHPQPETHLRPKPVPAARVLSLRVFADHLSVWADEREGIVSGELTLAGAPGPVAMGEELADYLVASRERPEGMQVVFAGAQAVAGPGELLRVYGVGPEGARLTRASFNGGQFGARWEEGVAPVAAPASFVLYANAPNPFNPETAIRFDLAEAVRMELAVYDLLGQRVRVLVSGALPAGAHRVVWDGRDERGNPVASGVYLCRLTAGEQRRSDAARPADLRFAQMRRMMLLK